jgi:rRNA-processing protein FCF1
MMPVECDVRVFEELERLLGEFDCVTPRTVIDELERLTAGPGAEATAASVGLDLAHDRCRHCETEADYADDALVELARTGDTTHIVTNDGPLKQRILAEDVSVISLRGQNKLAITQP